MTLLLNVAPRFDRATEYSFEWDSNFVDKYGECTSLLEKDAIKSKFDEHLPDHDQIVFFDHGNEKYLIGNDSKPLIDPDEAYKLKDKQIYTMACLSAKELGVAAYRAGCKEYWGAIDSIGFTLIDAHLFGEVFSEGALKRFKDKESIEDTMNSMLEHFDLQQLKTTDPWTKTWLQKDRDMWVVWHEGNPPPEPEPKTWWELLIEWLKKLIGLEYEWTSDELTFNRKFP